MYLEAPRQQKYIGFHESVKKFLLPPSVKNGFALVLMNVIMTGSSVTRIKMQNLLIKNRNGFNVLMCQNRASELQSMLMRLTHFVMSYITFYYLSFIWNSFFQDEVVERN